MRIHLFVATIVVILLVGIQAALVGFAAPAIQQPPDTPTPKWPTPTLPPTETAPPTSTPTELPTIAPTAAPTSRPSKNPKPQPTAVTIILPETGGTPIWPIFALLIPVVASLCLWTKNIRRRT